MWLHMRNERFLEKRHSKLFRRSNKPFQVLECINDNAYKLDLPGEYRVSSTFNVSNLSSFNASNDLRTNLSKVDENNAKCRPILKDPILVPIGPITIAWAKKLKEALNRLV